MGERVESFYDPSIFTDIERFNKGIDSNVEKLENLFVVSRKAEDQFRKSSKTNEDAQKSRNDLTEAEKEAEQIAKEQIKASESLEKQRQQGLKILAKLEDNERKMTEAINREVKSIKDAREQNKALRKAREDVTTKTAEGRAEIEKLNATIDENDALIKENVDSYTQLKIGIGGYEDAIKNALEGTQAFSGGAGNVINNFIEISQQEGGIKSFFTTFVKGLGTATRAGLKFIATPIGAIIFAIVAAITLFTAAISRNQASSDTFGKIWSGITIVIEEVIGRVFKLIGAIGKLLKGDFKGFAKDSVGAFTGLGKAMNTAYKEGLKLKELQIDLEKSTIKATKATAEFNAEAEKQQIISDDATRSFAERESAAERARAAAVSAATEQSRLAMQELEIVNLRVKQAERQGRINRELEQEQADAFATAIEAESNLTNIILENDKTRSELKQDRLEKDLDILIDGFDNVKTINERIIADETKTFKTRQQLLLDTAQLGTDSFNQQIETIRNFTKIRFDENELIAEQDSILLNKKIRELGLSEIIEGRLLEVIRERRLAIADLVEAQAGLFDQTVEIKEEMFNFAEIEAMMIEDEIANNEALDESYRIQAEIVEDTEQRKRDAKFQTLEAVKQIFGAESKIGKLATAAQKIEAIKQNLISLGIITAKQSEGIAKSAAALPFPANIPLILGTVAQFASIIGIFRKIPAFAKGTKSSPEGMALVGEKGFELGIEKSGRTFITANKPELRHLEGGTQIIPHNESKAILAAGIRGSGGNIDVINSLNSGFNKIDRSIRNNPAFTMRKASKDGLTSRHGNTIKRYNDIQFS